MSTSHMERNRARIAYVRAENLARSVKPKRTKAAKLSDSPGKQGRKRRQEGYQRSYAPSDPATFQVNPAPDLMYRFVFEPSATDPIVECKMQAVYKGSVLDWTPEQVSQSLHLVGAMMPAFNRTATCEEEEVIVRVVSEYP